MAEEARCLWNLPKFQVVMWRKWQGLHFKKAVFGLALIYDWYLWLGFLEIRKYHTLEDGDIARYMREEDDAD